MTFLAKSGAVPWELPVPVWLAVVAFGLAVFASLSWLFSRPIERYMPPERPIRYRRDGRMAAPDAWKVLAGEPLRGTITRHGPGTALEMPPKRHLSVEYRAYMASPEWVAKSRAFRLTHPRCQLNHPGCTGRSEQTHHRSYERLGRERADDLQAVCAWCHVLEEQAKVRRRGW